MSKQLSYWEKRQVQNMYHYMEEAEKKADEIAKLYESASVYINSQIDDIFEKYITKHQLTEEEALQLLHRLENQTSIDELLEKLREEKNRENKKELLAKLEGPAYCARIERLKSLQLQIDEIMESIYQQEKRLATSHYEELAIKAYYQGIYDLQQRANTAFSFNYVNPKVIDDIINSKWSGKNYSERIWNNTEKLAQDLKEEMIFNLITGRTNREAANSITLKYASGAGAARRLIRTESNYIATMLNFKSYEESGIEKYQFLATLDLRTSEVCRELDGKIFLVKEYVIGKNCPPMHPWCRSTTISVVNEEWIKEISRSALDPVTGKRIKVPRSMTYQEWYNKYVKGKPEAEFSEKQIKNRYSDKSQYKRYKEVLGDEIPEELDDFQRMKYTENEKWGYMKLDYQRRNKLLAHPELGLPKAEKVIAAEAKFEKYLFGGIHQQGLAKGQAFSSRLGYDINNWKMLRDEIIKKATQFPVTYKGNNGYGKDMYEQKMILYGVKGKPANVVVGWAVDSKCATMASAYIKEAK